MNDINDVSDRAIMAALGRQMTVAVQKQSLSTSNLANLDTPGYRTREASFDDVLSQQLQAAGQLVTTSPAHITGGANGVVSANEQEVDGLPTRRDGNNVQLDRELLEMTRASTDFSAAQTAMAAKFRLIRYAISEGR